MRTEAKWSLVTQRRREVMCSLPVLVLLLVLQVSIVAGDCWDDPRGNNESYDNCATCYQTFSNALINTGDNKYQLSKTFFPIDRVPPVEVKVTYIKSSNEPMANDSMVWYWLLGGFYVFQPLDLFLFRSLFFSPPIWRKDSLTLVLPDQCFSNESYFFEYATQRLKGYAQSQSSTPAIDNTYMGKAVAGNTVEITSDNFHGSISPAIVEAFYTVPFLVVLVVMTVITVFIAVYVINAIAMGSIPLEKEMSAIDDDQKLRANIIAGLFVCIIMTLFTAAVDIASLAKEDDDDSELPSYYPSANKSAIFVITIVFFTIYILYFVFGFIACIPYAILYFCKTTKSEPPKHLKSILKVLFVITYFIDLVVCTIILILLSIFVVIGMIIWCCKKKVRCGKKGTAGQMEEQGNTPAANVAGVANAGPDPPAANAAGVANAGPDPPAANSAGVANAGPDPPTPKGGQETPVAKEGPDSPTAEEENILCVSIVVCFVKSVVLSFSLHVPHILMAWVTDPFYASRIALFYGIIFFCYFITFHYAYAAVFSQQDEDVKGKKKNEAKSDFYERYIALVDYLKIYMGFMVFPFLFVLITGLIATVAIFIASIPVNNSIESSTDGITSIFNGFVILVGGILAYAVGWHYIGRSFSWKDALKKALNKTSIQNTDDWKDMNEEERLAFIMERIVVQQMKLPQENKGVQAPTERRHSN